MSDYVRFIAPCPSCAQPVVWTATKDPIPGTGRDTSGTRIECVRCDVMGNRQ